MRSSKKLPAALVLLVAVAAVALIAGCGGGSGSDGGEDPIALAPKDAPLYIEGDLAPDSQEADDLNGLVDTVVGIDDIGKFISEELEKSALHEGEKFDYAEEVEPWLGEKAGIYYSELVDGDFQGYGVAVETTDSGEAEDFIDKHAEEGDEKSEEGEFEGAKYYVNADDGTTVGVIGGSLAVAEDKAHFEEMVETSEGDENLGESPKYKEAIEAAGETGIGRVYVDIGGLIEEAGTQITPEAEAFFEASGIEPLDATAVVTGIPHSDQVEIDVSTDAIASGDQLGDASASLESLPATSILGVASPELGKSLDEAVAMLEKEGIPGQLEPGELGPALEAKGIDLGSITESLGNAAVFVEGSSVGDIGGAMVIETNGSSQAQNTVSNLGLLLRASQTPGVAPLSGNLKGFSISSPELGPQPLIIGAASQKIVIAYGNKAANQAVRSQAKTLGSTPDFEAAKSGLGSTPIGFFVDGDPALRLVQGLLSPEEAAEFSQAEPYVEKIAYIGAGAEAKGGAVNAKIVIGVQK